MLVRKTKNKMEAKQFNLADNPKDILQELLFELRICKKDIEVMSSGYSPNRTGVTDFYEDEKSKYGFPVLQLSQKLAEDINNLDLQFIEFN